MSSSRLFWSLVALLTFVSQFVIADFTPEQASSAKLGAPTPHWFLVMDFLGANVFDADNGDMLGKVHTSDYTSALAVDQQRGFIYVPGSYYSRSRYGDRTDVVVFNRIDTLSPAREVAIPNKLAAAGNGGTTDLIGGRFLGVYNMTPAMSVSIVDVEQSKFVTEIATAGSAMVYPVASGGSGTNAFMQICGDGTLQLLRLDANGQESSRARSAKFFDIDKDPVYDYASRSKDGWMLVSFAGQVFEARIGNAVEVSKPWSLFTDAERAENWRIGGRQPFAYNAETQTLFALVHQGKPDIQSHEHDGTEVWAFDVRSQRRGYKIELKDTKSPTLNVTADAKPLLLVVTRDRKVLVYDALKGRLERTINDAGFVPGTIQRF